MKNLIPPKNLKFQYLGKVSRTDFYQTRHIRVGVECHDDGIIRSHHLSFFSDLRRLDPDFCRDLAGKIGPGLDWKIDNGYSRSPRFFRAWADVREQERERA